MQYENNKYIITQNETNCHITIIEKQVGGETKTIGHIKHAGGMCESPEELRNFVLPFLKIIGREPGE